MSGRDDPIVPWVNGWIMAQLIRDARLHIFDDGHLGLMTSALELAPIVRSFLTLEEPQHRESTACSHASIEGSPSARA
jgi:hypothetical protein